MAKPKVSVVIPAYNEAKSIGGVIANCEAFCDEIIVVDDDSTDDTAEIAKNSRVVVIRNEKNLGVTKATQKGLEVAHGDIIVTIDTDGQHNPSGIPKLIEPLTEGKAEVALGTRDGIPRCSEKVINSLTNLRLRCSDAGTGFHAAKADIAKKLKLHGTCLCGTFVLEAHKLGVRIAEISVQVRSRIYGEEKVKTRHVRQFFYVLKDLIF